MSWANASSLPNVLPTPPGNSESPGEEVRVSVGVVVQQRDRAGGVAGDRDHLEGAVADRDRVAVLDPAGHLDPGLLRDRVGVRGPDHGLGAGGGDDVGEGPVVVPVLVGRHDGDEPSVADQLEEPVGSAAASTRTWSPVARQRSR